jgi:hypothetical protein
MRNDEIRMTKLEGMTNDEMMMDRDAVSLSYGALCSFRYSTFVLRHYLEIGFRISFLIIVGLA